MVQDFIRDLGIGGAGKGFRTLEKQLKREND